MIKKIEQIVNTLNSEYYKETKEQNIIPFSFKLYQEDYLRINYRIYFLSEKVLTEQDLFGRKKIYQKELIRIIKYRVSLLLYKFNYLNTLNK